LLEGIQMNAKESVQQQQQQQQLIRY